MSVTWEQMFGQAPNPQPAEDDETPLVRHLIAAGEEALTFILTFVALIAVVTSVERADWVSEMPSLGTAAAIGLFSGWALGRSKVPEWALHPFGIVAGAVVVIGLVMQSIRLEPGVGGIHERWSELWARNGAWLDALMKGNFSTDPLPFVLMVVFTAWFLAYLAAWAVVRWRNPWLALVPGAVALLTNISYLPGQPSAELILFLFAAILLFARMHLLKTVEHGGSKPPLLMSLEVLNLATWVGIALIVAAWMIPTANHWGPIARVWSTVLDPVSERVDRIGSLFIGVGSKRSLGLHTFEAVLPLQGSVELGTLPLLEVQAADGLYLRGSVYDQYVVNGWKQSSLNERPLPGTTVETASFGTAQTRAQARQPYAIDVHVDETITKRRLFSYGEPLAASLGARVVSGAVPDDILALQPNNELARGDQYATVGTVTAATTDRLITSSPDYPQWVRDRYLQLPADLPPDIRSLARQIAGDEKVPYKLAAKVEDYLRSNYTYSLDIGQRPQRADAVHYFLFDAKRGYSDYFASSMAVLLRALNVPSRVAVGFALDIGERDPLTKTFRVTDQNSWVWPQVYFSGYGWVDFNPTPSRPLIVRAGDDSDLATPGAGDLNGDVAGADPDQDLDVPALPAPTGNDDGANGLLGTLLGRLASVLVIGSALLLVVMLVSRTAWQAAYRRLSPATQRWAKLQWYAARAGIALPLERTPIEEASVLGAALARPPIDLQPLARAYVAERYGRKDPEAADTAEPPEAAEAMDTIYLQARGRLAKRAFGRLLRFWQA